jgi:periplasmic mercuric ion binding protein
MKKYLLAVALTVLTTPVHAASRTVTLSVPTMYCAVCPITVKKALANVPGVSQAEVSLDKHEAIVTFDDSRTSVNALTDATFDAGYPSELAASKQ